MDPAGGAAARSAEAPLCGLAHVRGARTLSVLRCQLFKRTITPIKTLSSLPQDARRLPTGPRRGDSAHMRPAGQTRGARLTFLEGSSLGSCPAGLGGRGSSRGACHTPGAAFPRQQGSGLRGSGVRTGQDGDRDPHHFCDGAGRPGASWDRPQPCPPPASSLQKNVSLLGPPRVPENIFNQRSKNMQRQAGWAHGALQRASLADDQGRRPSRPRGNPPWLLG